MQNGEEWLLLVLNKAKRELYGADCHLLTMGHLLFHAYDNKHAAYRVFWIPKKRRGEYRTISAPCAGLKCIQACLNKVLADMYEPHAAAMGFVAGRSVVDNAQVHVGQRYVYNIDLKDFFTSIRGDRIFGRLQEHPFDMAASTAKMVVRLCCGVDEDGVEVLPQGSPSSPILTNIVCERMDGKLAALAEAYGLRYTRYADDITFSGERNVFDAEGRFCKALRHIVEVEEGLTINADKTRLGGRTVRQEVTGLTVNEKVNVSKAYVKTIRAMLANWEKSGYRYAQACFLNYYHPTKNSDGVHRIENVLEGKLAYMKMVKGADDATYQKLAARFARLVEKSRNDMAAGSVGWLLKSDPRLDKMAEKNPALVQLMDALYMPSENER